LAATWHLVRNLVRNLKDFLRNLVRNLVRNLAFLVRFLKYLGLNLMATYTICHRGASDPNRVHPLLVAPMVMIFWADPHAPLPPKRSP
jgi:hypothetical protein